MFAGGCRTLSPHSASTCRPVTTGGQGRWRAVRRILAVLMTAGLVLLGIATAGPALASADRLVCSPDTNGGTLVKGVCVLPSGNVGQPYEAFILTSKTQAAPSRSSRVACR